MVSDNYKSTQRVHSPEGLGLAWDLDNAGGLVGIPVRCC